jgi:hypothetical protein
MGKTFVLDAEGYCAFDSRCDDVGFWLCSNHGFVGWLLVRFHHTIICATRKHFFYFFSFFYKAL